MGTVIRFSIIFSSPASVPLVAAGPVVGWIVSALEGAVVVGGVSALGAGLYSQGIPKNSVLKYETEIRDGKYRAYRPWYGGGSRACSRDHQPCDPRFAGRSSSFGFRELAFLTLSANEFARDDSSDDSAKVKARIIHQQTNHETNRRFVRLWRTWNSTPLDFQRKDGSWHGPKRQEPRLVHVEPWNLQRNLFPANRQGLHPRHGIHCHRWQGLLLRGEVRHGLQ